MRASTLSGGPERNIRAARTNLIEFARRSSVRTGEIASKSASKVKEQLAPNPHAVPWKGLVSGLIAGLAGTAAMTGFQIGWSEMQKSLERRSADNSGGSGDESSKEESSTVKVANAILQSTAGRPLEDEEKESASYAVHFAFGTVMGGIYGVSSEYLPLASFGHGLLHVMALWAGADALALPALGFSRPVMERSSGELAYEVLAHAVYGVTSESVREVVRGWLE